MAVRRKTLIACLAISLLFLRNLCFPFNEIVISDEKYVEPLESCEKEVLDRVKDLIFDDGFCNIRRRIGRGDKIIFWGLDNSIVEKSADKYSFSLRNARFIIFKKDLSTGKETKFLIPGLGFRKMETAPRLYSSEDGSRVAYVPLDSENKLRILLTDNFEVFDLDNPCEEIIEMVWSVKGDKLAIIGKDAIYISDMNTKATVKAYTTGYFARPIYFCWIGDSEMLFVDRHYVHKLELGKEPQPVFQVSEEASRFNLCPSPDGSKIIVGWENFGFSPEYEVWLINSKGEIIEELALFKKVPPGAREYEWGWANILWAPDSKKFVYSPIIMKIHPSGVYSGSPSMLMLRVLENKKDIKLIDDEVYPTKWLDSNRLVYRRHGEKRVLTLREQ